MISIIIALRERFKRECPELKLEREDDLFIIRFLRSRKFDPERSFELIKNYHEFVRDNASYVKFFFFFLKTFFKK